MLLLAIACGRGSEEVPDPARGSHSRVEPRVAAAAASAPAVDPREVITTALLRAHTQALADDAMEGRRPGTAGAARAVQYIVTAMKDLGLEPAGDDGTYLQRVPMRSVAPNATDTALAVAGPRTSLPLAFGTQWVGGSFGPAGTRPIDGPLVFAGYGVTAPEYDWDDYAGVDVTGKMVVVLVGDPPTDDGRFDGPAMTYYGRWSYKFERARAAGAAGCLIIHETEPASYGWNVPQTSWSGARFEVAQPDAEPDPTLQGWLSTEAAELVAKAAGASLAKWHERALAPNFRATELGLRLTGRLTTVERTLADFNVVGRVRGERRPDEAVYVLAHWDHLGVRSGATGQDDGIFNGAVDNASGVAALLAIAAGVRARAKQRGPDRSVVFVATTAEEQGLLGSRYHVDHPVVPLDHVVAVLNLDSMNVGGRTRTVEVVGAGQSTLEDLLADVVAAQGRRIVPESRPQSGAFFRSDHFPFVMRGVPALYLHGGADLVEGGTAAGQAWAAARSRRYHTVDDEYDPAWPFTGAEEDAEAMLDVVLRVADAEQRPRLEPGHRFANRP